MLFKRKKALIDYDPQDLDFELLVGLQTSLIAKLILVTEEAERRCIKLVEIAGPTADEAARSILLNAIDRDRRLSQILHWVLADLTRQTNSN